MARNQQAEIHILHIVEPLSLTYGADLHLDTSALQEDINEQAEVHLSNLAENLNIPNNTVISPVVGRKRDSDVAREIGADLIVLGSHGRWGLNFYWAPRLMAL